MHVIPTILGWLHRDELQTEYSLLPVMRRGLEFLSCTLEAEENLLIEYLKLE
jgi:hypothetical protein